MDDFERLERDGWDALATSGAAAQRFYGEILSDSAVFVLQGRVRLNGRQEIVDALADPPWSRYELTDFERHDLSLDSVLVIYHGRAVRADGTSYTAQFTSGYAKRGHTWKLAFHQQSSD